MTTQQSLNTTKMDPLQNTPQRVSLTMSKPLYELLRDYAHKYNTSARNMLCILVQDGIDKDRFKGIQKNYLVRRVKRRKSQVEYYNDVSLLDAL
jgi:hypothetical protein